MGQSGISLYHLGNGTIQGNHFNPAFFPEGKFFLGLPVLSGIAIDVNSPVSYNDLVTRGENDTLQWNVDNFINSANKRNYLSIEGEVSSIYLGFRPKNKFGFSVFARERFGARLYYGQDLLRFAWQGNAGLVGSSVDLSQTRVDARYYREYGLGIWRSMPKMGLNYGFRAKYINGMIGVFTDSKFEGTINVLSDFEHSFHLRNAALNMSGINVLDSSDPVPHFIKNDNHGFAIDVGAQWKINEYISAAVSVNDFGFINWSVDPENIALMDTTFTFTGFDIENVDDFGQALEDSLVNRFRDTTTYNSFRTGLNTTAFGSVSYHLTPNDVFTGTISSHVVQGHFRMLYAAGYTRTLAPYLRASANVIRIPQQGFDVGIGLAANLKAFQFYMAADKLINVWNVPEVSAVNLRLGFNFLFGKNKMVKDDRKDLIHPWPYGKKSKIIRDEDGGIYKIIKRKKPRPIYEAPESISGKKK